MVNTLRSAAAMTAIWLVAVVGVSATAWLAIDRAGRDITGAAVNTLPGSPLKTPTLGGQPSPGPDPAPTPAQATVAPPPRSAPSPSPTPAPAPAPSSRRPATRTTPAPTSRDRTIAVTGGLVSVRCTGSDIALLIAQPDNDWRVRVQTDGTSQIRARFTSGDEESAQRTEVSAECANGTPSFDVTRSFNVSDDVSDG